MKNIIARLRENQDFIIDKPDAHLRNKSDGDLQNSLDELQGNRSALKLQDPDLINPQREQLLSYNYNHHFFDLSPVAFLTLSDEGIIQTANLSAARLLGVSNDGLVNKKFDQFISPIDQGSYLFFIKDVLSSRGHKSIKLRCNCLNGDKIITRQDCQGFMYCDCLPESCLHSDCFVYVECQAAYSMAEEGRALIYLSLMDITEAVKAHETIACLNERLEQKLYQQTKILAHINEDLTSKIQQLRSYKRQILEREEKLNSIFNAAVEGIITIYLSGEIVSVNNAVENVFGFSKKELIGCNINRIIPVSRQKYQVPYQNSTLGIGFSSMLGKIKEVKGIRKDNTIVPLDISVAKFSIDGTSYLTCIVRDMTARKLQEQRDQEHLDELAYVTRLGLLGEMASGIAHEVNQPLTAIASYSQVCLNLIQRDDYDQAMLFDILKKTNQQALKAGHIIHRMRDFVKSKKIQRSTVDVNDLIYDAVGLCESYLKQNGVTVKLQLKKKIPIIHVDSIQIEQVILNLIRNGVDALMALPKLMPRNLSIQSTVNRDSNIEIRIKDNGPGIDIAEQKNILTPFYTTKSEGMGMGLSICRSIVEAHDGVLRFNSQPKKGTTFYFTVPMRRIANES
ncbi:MAG: PAS domain-containing sensor histidine kinase [Methylomonas sp.]